MKIQFVIHADFEQPGIIAEWAKQKGIECSVSRPFAGESLPAAGSFDWLIVMGGPQTPLKMSNYPYLQDEIRLIQEALARKKTTLGFCLGAQLIGEALGARTLPSPNREVGVFPVFLMDQAREDPLLQGLPQSFPVLHWHNDMPGLTANAAVLAYSEGCPHKIVRYGANIYGFQCHPEATLHDIKEMILYCPDDLKADTYVQPKEQIIGHDIASINQIMIDILNRLYTAALAPEPS